jgi:WD40 repeat protein
MPESASGIFICYRREDTDWPASWLFNQLAGHFGKDLVFKDVDKIEPGEDFVEKITTALRSCRVLLVLIGDKWLNATDENGQRRLNDPQDFVRLEIETALGRAVHIIPLLVGHTRMPRVADLPPGLEKLAYRQGVALDPGRFGSDTGRLMTVLDKLMLSGPDQPGSDHRVDPEFVANRRTSLGSSAATTSQPSDEHPATGSEPGGLAPQPDTPIRASGWPARNRRLLIVVSACALLAAAVAIPLILSMSGPSPASYLTLTDPDKAGVTSVAFEPGTAALAAGDRNGKIYLWDTTTKKYAVIADPDKAGVTSVAFEPGSSTTLAAGDRNGKIYLWDTTTRKYAVIADPDKAGVTSVAFEPGSSTTLAAADNNGNTYLWNTEAKTIIATLPTNPGIGGGRVVSVAFGPGGTTLAAADDRGDIWLSDTETRTVTTTLTGLPGNAAFSAVASAPDATTLAAAANGSIYLLDTSGKIIHTLTDPASKGVTSVALEPGGTRLAAVDNNGRTYLWDTETRTITAAFPDPARNGVTSVAFEPGGTTLALADANGSIFLWRFTGDHLPVRTPAATSNVPRPFTGTLNATLIDPDDQGVTLVAWESSGVSLAAVDNSGRIYLWDIPPGTKTTTLAHPVKTFTDPDSMGVYSVVFGPGATLATGDDNGHAYLWNTKTGDITATFTDPHTNGVYSVAFGPGGTLATGDDNGSTYLWKIPAGTKTVTLNQPLKAFPDPASRGVSSVVFEPDGVLATGDYNGDTYQWDTTTGQLTSPPFADPDSGGVFFVASEPGGTLLAVHDHSGRIYLWDTKTGNQSATFNDPVNHFTDPDSRGVYSVAFGPGGTLATGDDNGRTYLRNITTGQLTATFPDFASKGVYFVASEPGGTTLAAADGNGRIYLWETTSGT